MSSITNINNNSSVVNVGRTTPVTPGQQPSSRSIPVVLASDQEPVPVIEQNKIQSEVALSLLGIPRAEVALGIFADVNTYDINPSEWSSSPPNYLQGYGTKHLPNEAGALVETTRNNNAVLTSKRFFRYQPGRVSAATFGVKSSTSISGFAQNPVIRKYGIFDNFDGYYWETRQSGQEDNFSVVRRTQSLLNAPTSAFAVAGEDLRGPDQTTEVAKITQVDDYRIVGKAPNEISEPSTLFVKDRAFVTDQRYEIIDTTLEAVANTYSTTGAQTTAGGASWTATGDFYVDLAAAINAEANATITDSTEVEEKCKRDVDYWIDFFLQDMEWGGVNHTKINVTNYETAILPNPTLFERPIYTELKTQIAAVSGLSGNAVTKFNTLVDIPIAAFATSPVTVPSISEGSGSSAYGNKSKVDTIFDTKKHYWAYVVTTTTESGNTVNYSNTESFSTEDIKYKCQRDIIYVLDGYKNDTVGGGNAETIYNASMYYRGASDVTSQFGQSIYSQVEDDGTTPTEIERHTHLKNLVLDDLANTFNYSVSSSTYESVDDLSTIIIDNFSVETQESMVTGNRGFAGNLIAHRDGLLMVHAAVNDPNLLKEKQDVKCVLDGTTNTVKVVSGVVTFGQHVKYTGSNNGDLVSNTLYKVKKVLGPKGNEFTLVDESDSAITFSTGTGTIQLVNPFIFPSVYDPAVYRPLNSYESDGSDDPFPEGMMFPYMYADDENLTNAQAVKVGYINTTTDPTLAGGTNTIREQIDDVNFIPEYINWIKNNVKPEYYGVYEYRVPRTRFSHDKLDGRTPTSTGDNAAYKVVYSDLATGPDGIARPGTLYTENGATVVSDSEYEFDFTKVTMLKIEFSWYGAVGALFLAYIPVGNGEARWVRVHHLRASNQLKIASLGNATLPITYNVYGGGDSKTLGDGEETGGTASTTGVDQGYGTDSHNIIKYGASYYIDGGDRGTVRLYSHNNDDTVDAYGKQWSIDSSAWDSGNNAIEISANTITSGANTSVDPVYFMGAKLRTGNRADQNITVTWADSSKVYLSGTPQDTNSLTLLPDRANTVYGLETKEVILSTRESNSVRNRVQVYPTKLSTANLGNNPVRLRMKKTPLFQTDVTTSGTITLDAQYEITSENLPLSSVGVTESSAPFIENTEEIYGWWKASVGITDVTVFGRLYKQADEYYFELLESYNGTVLLKASEQFLPDKRFDAEGAVVTGTTKSTEEKEGLSSVLIATDTQTPIPGTGVNIATIYLQEGTEQLDLLSYFDYNKEYLSYPLTNIADTLYFAVDSDTDSATSDQVSIGITWEEQ